MSDDVAEVEEILEDTANVINVVSAAIELDDALRQVGYERAAQDQRFGQQDWPVLSTDEYACRVSDYRAWSELAKTRNAERVAEGSLSWDGILMEEVYEALSEEDPEAYETELIQVAAVAVNMWQASRRARGMRPSIARVADYVGRLGM